MVDYVLNQSINIRRKISVGSIFSWLIFSLIFLLIINAALPQFEMLLFSGHVPVPSIIIKFILIVSLVLYTTIYSGRSANRKSILSLLLFLLLFLVELALLPSNNFAVLIFGINAMYSLLIIALLMTNFNSTVNPVHAEIAVLFISLPLVILGMAQTIMNSPLLPLLSVGGYFKVLVWNYFGQVRAFSLFEAPAYYATYLTFFGGFVFGCFLIKRRDTVRFFYLFLLILVSVSEFLSLNRTAIFSYFFVIFTVLSIYKMRYRKKNLLIVMYVAMLSSVGLIFIVPFIHQSFSFVFAFNDKSMFERYSEWHYWLHIIFQSPHEIFFGSGVFQSSYFSSTKGVIIDNLFLAVLVQFGLVGLVVVLLSIYTVWSLMVEKRLLSFSPISVSCIAMITVWPIYAMFGTGLNIFPIYAVIPFLFKPIKNYISAV